MEEFFGNQLLFGEEILNRLDIFAGPVRDRLMVAITVMGNEIFYTLLIPLIYWCASKRIAILAGNPDPGNPESISIETLRLWELEGLIAYAGWRPDIENLYAESALVVVPTMYGEGVPTVLLEAAASGRPVVASDTPGCREFVEDGVNGLLVPPGDAMALALAIERLATNPPLRAEMGAQGREMVLANFTKQTVNEETLGVYLKAMA